MMTKPLSSRGALGWLSAALGASLSAAAFAIALAHAESILIFMAYLAALPLFVVGLGAGATSGILTALIGTVGLFLTTPSNLTLLYALINALPAAILIALAMRYRQGEDQKVYWYPEGNLLTALVIYPCILFLIATIATMGHEGGLLALSRDVIDGAIGQVSSGMEPEIAERFKTNMNLIIPIIPAMLGCSWMFLMLISAMAGQAILRQQNWLLRSPLKLENLHLPNWPILAVAAAGIAGYVAPPPYDYTGTNLCIMLCVPFFFVGLSVVHAFAATKSYSMAILISFYVVLSILVWLCIPVTVLGALDQNMNFRQRFAKQPKPN